MDHASHPHLRLAGLGQPRSDHDPAAITPRRRVTDENRSAAANPTLNPGDPRWVLAVRAYSQLDGTMLTPERRTKLMRLAQQLGMRPFDANVIVAIVQDSARRGQPVQDAVDTLEMVASPARRNPPDLASAGWRFLGALVMAGLLNAVLIWWLLS